MQASRRVRPLNRDDSTSTELPRHPRAVPVGLTITALVVAIDQLTKELAEAWLEPGVFVPVLGPHVGWQLVYNPGGAFGVPAPSWLFLVVTFIVVVIVGRLLPRSSSLLQAAAFGLLLAGALGNLIDRLLRSGDPGPLGGHVVDFVAWGAWPRFNVADSAITVAVVLLVVVLWRDDRVARAASERPADGSRADGDTEPS